MLLFDLFINIAKLYVINSKLCHNIPMDLLTCKWLGFQSQGELLSRIHYLITIFNQIISNVSMFCRHYINKMIQYEQ